MNNPRKEGKGLAAQFDDIVLGLQEGKGMEGGKRRGTGMDHAPKLRFVTEGKGGKGEEKFASGTSRDSGLHNGREGSGGWSKNRYGGLGRGEDTRTKEKRLGGRKASCSILDEKEAKESTSRAGGKGANSVRRRHVRSLRICLQQKYGIETSRE